MSTQEEYKEKLKRIINWSGDNDSFDDKFIKGLARQVSKGNYLTQKQMDAIDNIIEKFRISDDY